MAWLPVGLKREQVRERFNIQGNLCSDIAVSPDEPYIGCLTYRVKH